MNKIVVSACFIGLWGAQALAQSPSLLAAGSETVPMQLAEAEQRALDRNPAIAAARLSRQAAGFPVAESRAVYDPLFTASLTQRSQTTPASTQLSGGQEQVQQVAV